MRVRCDLVRRRALIFENLVAEHDSAEPAGDDGAGAAMQINAGIVVGGEEKRVIGRPESCRKDIGDSGLAAAVAGVAFGHTNADAHLRGG